MPLRTAFLVDADFYLRQYRHHRQADHFGNPEQVAADLRRHCIKHLYHRRRSNSNPNNEREQIGQLYRIFVYDCPPLLKKAHHPLTKQAVDFSRTPLATFRLAFHDALRKTPHVALRLGYLDEANAAWQVSDPRVLKSLLARERTIDSLLEKEIVYHARQKAVDMKLGLDVASLAYKRLVQRIVLIAGDSDFVPAAKLARREGLEFVLDPMWKTIRADLQEHVDCVRTTIHRQDQP